MGKKIYVGNLAWECTMDDLMALFQEYGAVARVQVISDRDTGRSRGFGFVEMTNDAEGNRAITSINGRDVDGRTLNINEAKPKTTETAANVA